MAKAATKSSAKKLARKMPAATKKASKKNASAPKTTVKKNATKKPTTQKTIERKLPSKKAETAYKTNTPSAKKNAAPHKTATKNAKTPPIKKPIVKKVETQKTTAQKLLAKKSSPNKSSPKKTVIKKQLAKSSTKTVKAAKTLASKKTNAKKSAATAPKQSVAKKITKPILSKVKATPMSANLQASKAKPNAPYKPVTLPEGYKPTAKEEYMNANQQEYFRQKLIHWRSELLKESRETLDHLHEEDWHQADIADRASLETEAGVELRTRNRYLKLISKIDAAIRRVEAGDYGYCEDTGEPIGLKRLEARPVATLCIEAQERHEKMEKQFTDEE